ncbi:MAG: hypothetical protein WCF84_03900 [Anaerolineae bacterium]
MLGTPSAPKSGENVWLWLFKILSGLLILIVLGIHFVVNHALVPGGLLTYQDIVNYYKNPIVPVMESAFLILVVPHALIGLRGIILDLRPARGLLQVVNWLFVIGGAAFIVYGIWLILVIGSRG